jgi:parallel beta-helix repeat protein
VVINSDGKAGQLPGGFRVDPAGARPIADFVATPTHGNAPLTVQFNDTFTSSPVMWEWAFGDGGTSNSQNTSHQYTNPGTYTVNLTVTNDDGSYREIKTNYINVTSRNSITSRSPVADFTTNVTQIPVNGFVQFYDNSTNTPSRWQWTFGDDLFYDSHQNPIHQYINPGVFSVHLTVSNSDGSDSEIKTNYIHVMKVNHAPTLTQITNQTTSVGIPLTLKITASDQDNDRLTYSAGGLPNGATFDPATRTFAWTPLDSMAGTFSVTFTVSDGVLSDSETCRIMVNSKPKILPTVQFNANALQGQAPLTVQFTDLSVSAGTTSYQWDMNNDGIVDYSSRNPVHTYKTAGTYTVKLTVTNADGSASEIKTNYITVSSPGVMLSSALYLDQFGIRGDGTDETSKLQSAFDYARDHSIRTVVFPQNKVITITSMVRFWGGLTVVGNGSTLKRKAYASMYPGSMLSVWDGARVSGLIIDGNYWTDDYGNPETYSDNGVILGDNVVFDNNEVKNVRAYSVQVYGDSNVVITNNKIHESYQYGITTGGGVGGESHNITVTGNTIYNCQQVGIKIRGTHGAVIRNNKITMAENSQFGRGISLYSYDLPNDDILIDGNTITGSFKGGNMDGISSDNSQNTKIRITNNIVSKCDIGIDLHFTGGTITGNKISECSTSIAGATGNIVTNNI